MSNASVPASETASPTASLEVSQEVRNSRLNAVKHGLFATDDIFVASLKYSQKKIFEDIREQLHTSFKPVTSEESDLTDRIAIQKFRLYRLYAVENNAIENSRDSLLSRQSILPHLDRFARYDWRINKEITELERKLKSSIHDRISKIQSDRLFPKVSAERQAIKEQFEKQRLAEVEMYKSLLQKQ